MHPEEHAGYHGRETETRALGRTWRFARWEADRVSEWLDWAKKHLPDPVAFCEPHVARLAAQEWDLMQEESGSDKQEQARARKLHFLRTQQERLTRMAIEEGTSYLGLNSPKAQALFNNPEGLHRVAYLSLRQHHPEITPELARDVVNAIPDVEMARIIAVINGKTPPPDAAKK